MTDEEKEVLENYRKNKEKKKNRFGKFIVVLVILLNCLLALGVLYVFRKTGSEPSVLVGSWFAFTTGELWHLASIKKNKIEKGDKNE
jgi:hypothetical protein